MIKETLDRLIAITDGCRADMHEPDNNGIKARVIGGHLDNVFGDSILLEAVIGNFQELVVIIERDGKSEKFNLATLIALARTAKIN